MIELCAVIIGVPVAAGGEIDRSRRDRRRPAARKNDRGDKEVASDIKLIVTVAIDGRILRIVQKQRPSDRHSGLSPLPKRVIVKLNHFVA